MKQYFILFRPYGMLFLGFTPFFGAIANEEYNLFNLLLLCLIGFLVHVFTFVLNDYCDIEIDRKSKYVINRPLTTGSISKKTVVGIFISSFIISITLNVIFLFTLYSFLSLVLTFACMTLYNKYSKRYVGMEYILGLGVLSLSIFGSFTVSDTIMPLALLAALFGLLQWLFSVGIAANLKDVEFDTKQGIITTPVWFGTHIAKTLLIIPTKFKLYAYCVKIIHIVIGLLILEFGKRFSTLNNYVDVRLIFLLISFVVLYCSYKIFSTPIAKRDTMLIFIGIQEGLSFLLLPISLLSSLLIQTSLLFTSLLILIMISWPLFCFRILFGKHMIPLE